MEQDLENVVNTWHQMWVSLHDPFEDDFSDELYKVLPHHHFTYDVKNNWWIYLGTR